MAATVSAVQVSPLPGGNVLVAGLATLSANYQAAGETMDLSSYLLSSSSPVIVLGGDDGYVPQSDRGTAAANTIQLFEAGADAAALDEVANSTDTSAVICTFVAIGQTP